MKDLSCDSPTRSLGLVLCIVESRASLRRGAGDYCSVLNSIANHVHFTVLNARLPPPRPVLSPPPCPLTSFFQVRQSNRVEALVGAENVLTNTWRNEDLTFAQQAASILLPLLQLDRTVENDPVLSIGQSSLFIQGRLALEIIHSAVESTKTSTTSTSRRKSSFARLRRASRRTSNTGQGKSQEQGRCGKGGATVRRYPQSLRPSSHLRLDGVASERRCQGDGPLERESKDTYASGSLVGPVPEQLARDVLRLRGEVAMVRAVLEPPLACDALHPDSATKQNVSNESAGEDDSARCDVRCVVRIEAYFPVSSSTVCARFRVSSTASIAATETTTSVSGDERMTEAVRGLCLSRKRQREILREKLQAEAAIGFQTMSNVLKQAASRASSSCHSKGRDKTRVVNPVHLRVNNAFSSLLIRADVRIPVERICLGNGSWRETVGELVGCPCGVELRTVSDTAA